MYSELPKQVQSRFGFQGCLASLELNGIVIDPAKVEIAPLLGRKVLWKQHGCLSDAKNPEI